MLNDVLLYVDIGEIVVIFGVNGVGKLILFKVLLGISEGFVIGDIILLG